MFDRIEINPRVCNGNPVIRGTRIPVAVILDHLAADETWESILEGFPELAREDWLDLRFWNVWAKRLRTVSVLDPGSAL